jgi:hypothetical protein
MTANNTSRLGLMSPVGSDAFVTTDFANTFNALDANPGVLPVANAASRPSNYTTAQHGSQVIQMDLGIVWVWYQPNSGVTGQWNRVGNTGFLAEFGNSGTVSTSTTNYASGPTVASGTFTLPGGRPMLVNLSWLRFDNYYGPCVVSYWENSTRILDLAWAGFQGTPSPGTFWLYRNPAPAASLSINAKITIASYNASAPNGGGSTTMGNANLAFFEV